MKKNGWLLLLFIGLGLVGGSLLAQWLKEVPGLSFLTRTTNLTWSPAADLVVFSYDLTLKIEVSLLSILTAGAAIWLYRKM
ncbi:DUF4321 domain-containing protein [Paenibacillus sp. GCM10012307]|uniref:DUF4321 domain-containing protein n=1 Tax=Paenibacillus roseus TaxID=2798579 RepID=A0A934MW93_9BACL|nr:DUF4321 domain-containing protein [Paenibacillus roseus]MBJ6362922.1 DUF4321 domain-containing protein [Paenibacillus roseus]